MHITYIKSYVARIWEGEGQDCFPADCGICMSQAYRLGPLLGEFGGMPPPPKNFFLKLCNFVCFGVYLDKILSLNFVRHYHFLYKK